MKSIYIRPTNIVFGQKANYFIQEGTAKSLCGLDDAGFLMKEKIKIFLNKSKIKSLDLGTFSEERVDYPDYAKKLALSVKKKSSFGILICGSGIGVSIAANRFKKVRAAVCYNQISASLARKHNNAKHIPTAPLSPA